MKKIAKVVHWAWRKMKAFWPWYKSLYVGKPWYTKTLVAFVSFIAFIFIYLGAVDINFLWLRTRLRRSIVLTENLLVSISMRTVHL